MTRKDGSPPHPMPKVRRGRGQAVCRTDMIQVIVNPVKPIKKMPSLGSGKFKNRGVSNKKVVEEGRKGGGGNRRTREG